MIKYKTLTRDDAKKIITEYDNYDDSTFNDLIQHWVKYDSMTEYDESFSELRREILDVFKTTLEENYGKINYILDLKVGLKLYSILPVNKNFTIVQANDDDFWRYVSVKVVPDLTYMRYPDPEQSISEAGGRLNHKRFYSHTRRIWIKSLWWYIHLSWQGDEEKTYMVLKDNTVDNINKLIETPGRGYRVELYRAMMAEYAATGPHTGKEFAAFTKMNNAKCVLIEPALTAGGEKGYAHRLFQELKEKKLNGLKK